MIITAIADHALPIVNFIIYLWFSKIPEKIGFIFKKNIFFPDPIIKSDFDFPNDPLKKRDEKFYQIVVLFKGYYIERFILL